MPKPDTSHLRDLLETSRLTAGRVQDSVGSLLASIDPKAVQEEQTASVVRLLRIRVGFLQGILDAAVEEVEHQPPQAKEVGHEPTSP